MAARLAMLPEDQFLLDGLKAGWVTRQEVAMRRVLADYAYQARADKLDMAHVRNLAEKRDAGVDLLPVVVFDDGERFVLADGFHRHRENEARGCPSIRAYVVTLENPLHEARKYAAMCNKLAAKKLTPEDVRKQLDILFADEACWAWSSQRIAAHCGVSRPTVERARAAFASRHQKEIPEKVLNKNGVLRSSRSAAAGEAGIYRAASGVYSTSIKGKTVHLGTNPHEAGARYEKLRSQKAAGRAALDYSHLQGFFARRGLAFEACGLAFDIRGGMRGYCGHGVVWLATAWGGGDTVPWAVGCLRLLRRHAGRPDARMVVVCDPGDAPTALAALAEQDGVEFLTPEGLLASLAGGAAP